MKLSHLRLPNCKIISLSPLLLVCAMAFPSAAYAQMELSNLSLEQLMSVEVTSASDEPETLGEIAGAAFVISSEAIRRSGVTSVAEALRMAPGMHVARIDDTRWAVTSRGFNDQFSNKLSVMIDGRHIYTPNFAGVFWDDHMPLIDNVERIEVIRGPGAAIEGLNAVNGIINIVSRSVRDTQGVLLQGRIGNQDFNGVTARYGNVTNAGWYYRFDYHSVDENFTDSPLDIGNKDKLSHQRASFRLDSPKIDGQSMQMEGSFFLGDSWQITRELYSQSDGLIVQNDFSQVNSRGFWLRANWDYENEQGETIRASAYVENTERDYRFGEFGQETLNINMQGRHLFGDLHDVNWGFETYFARLPFNQRSQLVSFSGSNDDYHIYRFHIQDEISVREDLSLILGSRLEKSQYVDWRAQPSIRLSWKQSPKTALWASIASAYRNPSFGESEYRFTPSLVLEPFSSFNPAPLQISTSWEASDVNFGPEKLLAYEAGLKTKIGDRVDIDLSIFNFHYEDTLGGGLGGINCQPSNVEIAILPSCLANSDYISLTTLITNDLPAESTGVEITADWLLQPNWRIQTSFSWFDFDFTQIASDELSIDFTELFSGVLSESEPEWLAYLRSEWTISENLELDVTFRAVDESQAFAIDSYTTADIRFEWKPSSEFRFELIGQNLLGGEHEEFGSRLLEAVPSHIQRGVFARLTWAP